MNCLSADLIYMYLEEELSAAEKQMVQDHLSSCKKCQRAMEERRLLVEASQSLPLWKVPADFTPRIMARIFLEKASPGEWIATASVGIFAAVLAFFTVFMLSGQDLVTLLANLSYTVLTFFRNIIVALAKSVKVLSLAVEIIYKFISSLLRGWASIATLLGPELQILLTVGVVIFSLLFLYGVKRKFLVGEKT